MLDSVFNLITQYLAIKNRGNTDKVRPFGTVQSYVRTQVPHYALPTRTEFSLLPAGFDFS